MSHVKSPSDPKNPVAQLQDYFDDLLGDLSTEEQNAIVSFPTESSSSPTSFTRALPSKLEIKPRQVEVVSNPAFAEPEIDQKEKLQKLLHSVRPKIETSTAVKLATAKVFVADPEEIQDWVLEPVVTVIVEQPVRSVEIALDNPQPEISPTSTKQLSPDTAWLPNGRPQWAQARFDVLLFQVSGLTLAVPLVALGQIQPLTDELTPLFGQADWFMGLQPTSIGQIRTVNTAKFVMPERYDDNFLKTAKYVVSISGVPWGLAVDSVNQPISLEPEEVKWRSDRSKRPWLAGTVKQYMCALLDIPMIGKLLMEADKNIVKSRA